MPTATTTITLDLPSSAVEDPPNPRDLTGEKTDREEEEEGAPRRRPDRPIDVPRSHILRTTTPPPLTRPPLAPLPVLVLALLSASRMAVAVSVAGSGYPPSADDSAFPGGLRDPPMRGGSLTYLDGGPAGPCPGCGTWYASSSDPYGGGGGGGGGGVGLSLTVPARVPGDLISDLAEAGAMGDPLYELNFKNHTLWSGRVWNYTTTFPSPPDLRDGEEVLLVLDGIKMGAHVHLNGVRLGTARDQFLRYSFPLISSGALALVRSGSGRGRPKNELTVSFDPSIDVSGRFMACSGGWDWAPYTDAPRTADTGSRTHTLGIWKSVYLVRVSSAAVTAVVPQVYYRGDYPTEALVDGEHAGFDVDVRVHLWSPRPIAGTVEAEGSWGGGGGANSSGVVVVSGEAAVTVRLSADADEAGLWWPAGTGPEPSRTGGRELYDVSVRFVPSPSSSSWSGGRLPLGISLNPVSDSRRVGFRHFALVTGNDTDPSYVRESAGMEGTSSAGMFFRVNGAPVWSRGANVIPMDEMEGRLDAEAHVRLVRSAAEGNMNTLRVWGGGAFMPEAWYRACDEYGIMVYHDMMYAQGGHSPAATATQELEIRHSVRRLASHPSVVIWDGCNECRVRMEDDTAVYARFVLTTVAEEDASRAVWPSCPASGWVAGVERLTSRPTGSHLVTPDDGEVNATIETHGSYVHGTGFPAVNGATELRPVGANIPIDISPDPAAAGISRPSVYASEFGCVGMSSFESMSPTLLPRHWGLHGGAPPDECSDGWDRTCVGGNAMAQRNYPCDNVIEAYFDTEPGYFDGVGEDWFRRQLYHCMMGQALNIKGDIEERRSRNELGHLVWQLNEIWPTGGWGSLEYGNPRYPGQVLGGRWKPLHYFYRASVFADVMAACGKGGACYVRNDSAGRPFRGTVSLQSINVGSGRSDWSELIENVSLPPGPGSMMTFSYPFDKPELDGTTHFMMIHVESDDRSMLSRNVLLLQPPKRISNLPPSSGLQLLVGNTDPDGTVPITVTANVPVALFVVLTTMAPGRFSDNAFPILGGSALVYFHPFGDLDASVLRDTLRAEDLAHHARPPEEHRRHERPVADIAREAREARVSPLPAARKDSMVVAICSSALLIATIVARAFRKRQFHTYRRIPS